MCKMDERINALTAEATKELGTDFFETMQEIATLTARIKTLEKSHKGWKESLAGLMEKHGVTTIRLENGTVISYKPAYDSMIADTEKMKEDNIYDEYSKPSHHSATCQFKTAKK